MVCFLLVLLAYQETGLFSSVFPEKGTICNVIEDRNLRDECIRIEKQCKREGDNTFLCTTTRMTEVDAETTKRLCNLAKDENDLHLCLAFVFAHVNDTKAAHNECNLIKDIDIRHQCLTSFIE